MWRIIMNTVRMILCGNVEDSRMNPSEKVGVVSVVFVSTEELPEKIKNKEFQERRLRKKYLSAEIDLPTLHG